jgi:hypothetical protein
MATQTRVPTGDGTGAGYTASGAASVWEAVDDPVGTPDDDTTYGVKADGNSLHELTFAAFAIDASAVNFLQVLFRARLLTGDALTGRAILRVGGNAYTTTAPTNNLTDAYDDYTHDYLTNPDTGLAWTEADIEGSGSNPLQEYGVRNQSTGAGEEIRLTQCYATVDYDEAGGGGTILPHLMHYLN